MRSGGHGARGDDAAGRPGQRVASVLHLHTRCAQSLDAWGQAVRAGANGSGGGLTARARPLYFFLWRRRGNPASDLRRVYIPATVFRLHTVLFQTHEHIEGCAGRWEGGRRGEGVG